MHFTHIEFLFKCDFSDSKDLKLDGALNGNLVVWTSDGVGYLNCGGSCASPPLSFCAPEVFLNFSGINLAEKTLSGLQIQQPVSGVWWIYRLSGAPLVQMCGGVRCEYVEM